MLAGAVVMNASAMPSPNSSGPATDCLLLPAAGREPGERAARAMGLNPRLTVSKHECAGRVGSIRRAARKLGIDTFVVHSADWDRQPMPQFYELAALRMRLPDFRFLSGEDTQIRLSRARLTAHASALPLDVARALTLVGAETAHLRRARRHARATPAPGAATTDAGAVLAIWHGSPGTAVGGSVTHISGILAGFRRAGLRTGLATMAPPPPQLADVVDDVEVVPPMPRHARLSGEVGFVCANRYLRAAARRLLALRPSFVYQRYDAFITCGVDVAEGAGIPLVLEWNASEVWTRANWHVRRRFKQLLDPMLTAAERYAVERSSVICSVSRHAGQMAIDAGAPPARVIVVPNGVDIEAIDAGRKRASRRDDDLVRVGWVGSFGSWHGADVLVHALAQLPEDVTAVMIGDGGERPACEALARDLGLDGRIEWAGMLPHDEAIARLAECDLLASPHIPLEGQPFFGSPTKLFEYMAVGRPIVASSLEQIGEILRDGETARLVEPGDAADLARGIRDVLEQPDRGRHLGETARDEAEAAHTWDQRARAVLDALRDSAGRGAGMGQETLEV